MADLPTAKDVSHMLSSLAQTDEKYARLTAAVKALDHKRRVIRAIALLETSGTVAEREALATASKEYQAFIKEYENTIADREILAAKRKRAELTIDVWRSLNSARSKGQIV